MSLPELLGRIRNFQENSKENMLFLCVYNIGLSFTKIQSFSKVSENLERSPNWKQVKISDKGIG